MSTSSMISVDRARFPSLFAILLFFTSCSQIETISYSATERAQSQEEQIRLIAYFALIPIVVAFSFLTFVFYRRRREEHFKKVEAELKLSKAEVEMKALKAQINPHFIFNCMNSIHHYMHKNDIKNASDYLIKFSQLIRLVLENSSLKHITLREELQTLDLYIQLERLRLEHRFAYQIIPDPSLDLDNCELPGFLIQPFVENAIWHELTRIEKHGELKITITKAKSENAITCSITSFGTGRLNSTRDNALTEGIRKTSLGLNLIRERIDLLNRTEGLKASFIARDISEPDNNRFGFHVELIIPVLEE